MFLAGFWPVYQFLWTVYFITMFLMGFFGVFYVFRSSDSNVVNREGLANISEKLKI